MPVPTCINPLEYFVQYAEDYLAYHPGLTFADVLDQLNVFQNELNLCCPCNNKYFLGGSAEQAATYYTTVDPDPDLECCVNVVTNIDTYVTNWLPALPDSGRYIKRCCNGFSDCLNDITNEYPIDFITGIIYDTGGKGIFEISSFQEGSLLCTISKWVCEKGVEKATEYFSAILEKGLVISCMPNGVFIGSFDTFITTYYPTP